MAMGEAVRSDLEIDLRVIFGCFFADNESVFVTYLAAFMGEYELEMGRLRFGQFVISWFGYAISPGLFM